MVSNIPIGQLVGLGLGLPLGQILLDLTSPWIRVKGAQVRYAISDKAKVADIIGEFFALSSKRPPNEVTGLAVTDLADMITTAMQDALHLGELSDIRYAQLLINGILQTAHALGIQMSLGQSLYNSLATYRGSHTPTYEGIYNIAKHYEHLDGKLLAFEVTSAGATIPHTAYQVLVGMQNQILQRTRVMDQQMRRLMDEYTKEYRRPLTLLLETAMAAMQEAIYQRTKILRTYGRTIQYLEQEVLANANSLMDEVEAQNTWYLKGLLPAAQTIPIFNHAIAEATALKNSIIAMHQQLAAKRDQILDAIPIPYELINDAHATLKQEVAEARGVYLTRKLEIYSTILDKTDELMKDIRAYRGVDIAVIGWKEEMLRRLRLSSGLLFTLAGVREPIPPTPPIPPLVPMWNLWALDTDDEHLYAGFSTYPAKVVKVAISTFTRVGTLTFYEGEDEIRTAIISGDFYYAPTYSPTPSRVVKVVLPTFSEIVSLVLSSGENYPISTAISGHYLYIGLNIAPGRIVKIDLDTFTRIGALTLGSGEDYVNALAVSGGYLYAGLGTWPAKVVKIDLSTFTKVGTITFASGETGMCYNGMVISGNILYCLTTAATGKLVLVDLATFTRIGALTIGYQCNPLTISGSYLYTMKWLAYPEPSSIVKIRIDPIGVEDTLDLIEGESAAREFAVSGTHLYAGIGDATPAKIVKIDLTTFTRVGALTLYEE